MTTDNHNEMLAALRRVTSRELQELGPPFPEGAKARRTKKGDLVVDWSAVPREDLKPNPKARALIAALTAMGLAPRV